MSVVAVVAVVVVPVAVAVDTIHINMCKGVCKRIVVVVVSVVAMAAIVVVVIGVVCCLLLLLLLFVGADRSMVAVSHPNTNSMQQKKRDF